jgi:hypothetical protein
MMTKVLAASFFLLFSVSSVSSFTVCQSCSDELNNVLSGVFLPMPSQNFTYEGFYLNMTHIACGNLVVPHISVEVAPNMSLITFQADSAQLSCDSDYAYANTNFPYFPFGSGNLNVTANGTNTEFQVALVYNETSGLPTAMNVTSCSTNLAIQTAFTGSIFSGLLQGLVQLAENYFQEDIESSFCTGLSQVLDITGMQLIEKALNASKFAVM